MRSENGDRASLRLVATDGRVSEDIKPVSHDLNWSILMARAQEGDQAAYHRLLTEITGYIRALAVRRHRDPADVEDSVQDVLLTLHAVRQTYDPTRPFGPWLVTIAERRFIDRLRQQGRRRSREVSLEPEHETFCDSPSNSVPEQGLEKRELDKAISALPPAQREAVQLLKIKELSLIEASLVSGISVNSLKVNVHRAIKSLRKMLIDRSQL